MKQTMTPRGIMAQTEHHKRRDISIPRPGEKIKRFLPVFFIFLILASIFTVTAHADGDVAGAIKGTWDAAKGQIKTVVNMVVFPAIDLILAVLFFVKLGTAYMDYRKHGQFEFAAPAILFFCLVLMLTAPNFIWGILGM